MPTGRIAETFHLQQSDLIKATDKNVNDMAVVSGPFGKIIVELDKPQSVTALPIKEVASLSTPSCSI